MVLAVVLALMTAAAVFAVLWPLSRARGAAAAAGSDVAVYRDQLDEIARDRAAGTIDATEAEAARVEVSRRLLGAADRAATATAADPAAGLRRRRATAAAALVLIPVGAGLLYLALGSPALPGQPLSARLDGAQDRSMAALIARVESHLEQSPDDGRGWEVIAPVYLRLGRFDDAVQANRNALRLLGETPGRQANLAEALVAQAGGVVTAEAKSLFDQVSSVDPDEPRAPFYLGLAAEQDGRRADAARIWRALLARAPADAPWLPAVRDALARAEGTPQPGPSAEDIAAASELSPAERDKMVRAMVDRLEARLHDDGSDVEGWLRLMRARLVLGERDKAKAAASDARRALKDAPDKLRQIDDGAKSFGLDG